MLATERQAWRFFNHGLLTTAPTAMAVTQQSVGIQGQAQRMAELNLALRSPTLTQADLQTAYANQALVRSWGQRWTVHLMTPADWNLVINARASEHLPNNYYLGRREAVLRAVTEISTILVEQPMIDRPTTLAILARHKLNAEDLYAVLQTLTATGVGYLDAGIPTQKFHFIAAGEHYQPLAQSSAIKQLILRYLDGFAPATIQDFAKWSGIKISKIRPIWQTMVPELTRVSLNGTDYFSHHAVSSAKLAAWMEQMTCSVIIAARFDSLMTGYVNKDWLMDTEHQTIMWSKNGLLMAPVIIHGRVVGKWEIAVTKTSVSFTVQSWQTIHQTERQQLEQRFAVIANFLARQLHEINYEKI